MKKKLLGLGLLLLASTASYAISGSFGMGVENEDYHGSYSTTNDMAMPYFTASFKDIIPGNPLTLDLSYSYRYKVDDASRAKDRRDRYEAYLGYKWKWNRFTFSPKIGIRHEAFAHGESSSRQATARYQSIYRIYPNFSYKINDDISYYLSGFVAPTKTKLNPSKKRAKGVKGETYYDDYKHELESGLSFTLSPTQNFKAALYSEYERLVDDQSKEEWQLRLSYSHKLNSKLKVEPYARIGIDRDQRKKHKKNTENESKDILRHRFGIKANYAVTDTFTLLADVYWQTERQGQYSGGSKSDKELTFYKIGFIQAF